MGPARIRVDSIGSTRSYLYLAEWSAVEGEGAGPGIEDHCATAKMVNTNKTRSGRCCLSSLLACHGVVR